MRLPYLLFTAALTLLLTLACAGLDDLQFETRPPPTPDYVGTWEGPEMRLTIGNDGSVEVVHSGNSSSEFKAPAMSWDEGELVIGIGPISKAYSIDTAPHETMGEWRMVVNGVPLTRTEPVAVQLDPTGKPILAEPLNAPTEKPDGDVIEAEPLQAE